MAARRSSIHSDSDGDDEKLIISLRASDKDHEHIALRAVDASFTEDNPDDNNDSDGEILFVEASLEPPKPSAHIFTQAPARYAVAAWAFFGFFCLYALRVNFSVAIVAMAAPINDQNQSKKLCTAPSGDPTTPTKYEFDWDSSKQGLLLGAFFYGYITMQIIGGYLAERIGPKWILGGGIFIAGVLSLLAPVAARASWILLFIVRFLTGVVCGPGYPSAAALWGRWIPPAERSTIPPAAQAGATVGIIFTTPLVSVMIGENFLGGWPSSFYVFGALSCVWAIGWHFYGFNAPDQHPRISLDELSMLTKQIPAKSRQRRATPWLQFLKCPSIYGIAIIYLCHNYIYYTLLTSLPIYFSKVLFFDLHQSGFIFALPYIAHLIFTVAGGYVVDRIRERKIISLTALRKIQTIIGMAGTCGFLLGIGYVGCNHVAAVALCTLAVGFLGFQSCGSLISYLDVASNYAGTLMGITNTLGTIPGFIGPMVVGMITKNNQTVEAWRMIFNISAGIGAFGCVAYCILFKGEETSWNRSHSMIERRRSTNAQQ